MKGKAGSGRGQGRGQAECGTDVSPCQPSRRRETAAPEHTPARGAGGPGMSRHSCTSCSLSWLPQEEVDFNSKAEVDPKELMTRVCHLITRLVAGSVLP